MTQQDKTDLWDLFKTLGADALTLNHYELEQKTKVPNTIWKEFLNEPDVADWIRSEITLLRKAEMHKIVKDVSSSKSVGQAQLMTALQKLDEKSSEKEGPIFVYCYIPLNSDQADAPNVVKLEEDPFLR